jgi:dihydrofolate synthase/folylpolyglutamate synthase
MKNLQEKEIVKPIGGEADFERFIGRFTNYERMKSFLYAPDTLRPERMEGLARELGDPQTRYPTVHIAGTKGKGTTSLMLEALLAAPEGAVGTYTSPHVEKLTERIRVAGKPISMEELCETTNSILPILEARWMRGEQFFPTFFELMTILAMLVYGNHRVSWGIFEVGLGGRLDATNVLRPRWTAITSIGLEHTQALGNSIELIAREKAGIVKGSTPLVLGEVPPEAEAVIRNIAEERSAPVIAVSPGGVRREGANQMTLNFPGIQGTIPAGAVRGPALRADLELALTLWLQIQAEAGRRPELETIRSALTSLELPARVEVIGGNPPVVIDGAHTAESIRALREALDELDFPGPRVLVFALGRDKSSKNVLREVGGLAGEAFITRVDPIRGRDPAELAAEFRKQTGLPAEAVANADEAFQRARGTGRPTVVTGSFYLAGHLRPLALALAGGSVESKIRF